MLNCDPKIRIRSMDTHYFLHEIFYAVLCLYLSHLLSHHSSQPCPLKKLSSIPYRYRVPTQLHGNRIKYRFSFL